MRIGIDARPALHGRGGIAVYTGELLRALATTFPQDDVVAWGHRFRAHPDAGPRAARLTDAGRVRLAHGRLPSRVTELLGRWGLGVDRWMGGRDVLHLTDYALLPSSRAALVATVHDVLFDELPRCYTPAMRRGLRAVTRHLVRRASRLLVPSVRTKIALVERYRADPERVDVVPLAPRPLPPGPAEPAPRPYVLAVGTLEPRKNHDRLLAAHAILRGAGHDVDLVVVGSRGWTDERTVAHLAASPGVRWLGPVDDARLAALYRGALALAYPSLGEGYGLPVAEALAAGLPVVTSAGTACADLAGDAALLVDPHDVEALADALRRLVEGADLRAALAHAGRRRARGWSWTDTARGTHEAYVRARAG